MEDWKKRIIERDGGAVAQVPDWKRLALENDSVTYGGPDARSIDDSADAPALIRMEVGALDKPGDRLKALQKHFPDAQPYGDNNFIYTENGKTRLYNQESWFPSLGDFASIAPELGETVGGAVGGAVGAIGGGTAGSVVPILGTGAGAVTGAMAGAGTGSVAGREATQRGLNYLFGNEDTRTAGEQVGDAAQTFALGAAGEGIGRGIGAGFKAGKNAWNSHIIGKVDDVGKVAERAADLRAIGAEPTAGMVSGNKKTAVLEHALMGTRPGQAIQSRIDDVFAAQSDEFGRVVGELSDKPLSVAEAGEALRRQTELAKEAAFKRSEQLYGKAAEQITSPAVVDKTGEFLKGLIDQQQSYGEFDKLTRGAQTDQVIKQATAIITDAQQGGMSFDKLKQARSYVGQIAADTDDKVLKNQLNGLYASLTSDMEKTALTSGPDAKQAFQKANNHFRRTVDSEKGFGKGSVADTILKKNTDDIFNYAVAGAKNGGNRIAQIRRTVERSEGGKEAWDQVISGFTDRLGRNSADDYDPGTFLRGWSKTSEEAKDALFKGTKNAQYRADLDRLARIGDNWTKYRKSANHSNTQSHRSALDSMNPMSKDNILASALGLASGVDPASALAMGAAKGVTTRSVSRMSQGSRAKLLQDPNTVNWLANVPQAEMKKGGIKAHVGKLVAIGRSTTDNALAAAINDYLRDLGFQEEQQQ